LNSDRSQRDRSEIGTWKAGEYLHSKTEYNSCQYKLHDMR